MARDDRYEQLVEAAPDGIVVVDGEGRIVLVNQQAERMFGYERAELLGQLVELLVPERYRPPHPAQRRGFTAHPTTRPMGSGRDLQARRKDGSELPVEISLSPIYTPEGVLISSTIRDITDRRQAELAIRQLAAIVDSSADAIMGEDLQGRVTSWNRGAESIFGYTAEEVLGRSMAVLFPAELREEDAGLLARILSGESVEHYETERLRKDGQRLAVSVTLSPIRDGTGQVVGVSRVARDITERRRMEEQTRRSSAYLLSAVESIADAFSLYDEHDRLVLLNSAARDLLGRDLSGPIDGRSFTEILDSNLEHGTFDAGAEGPGALRARWQAYHADPKGTFDLRTAEGRILRVRERRTAEGGWVQVIDDITEDVAREKELVRARGAAEAASAAKTEFLSSMSHELRTPLNAILGFAQLLQRDKKTPLTDRQQERLAHVLRGGEHLLRLIDEVLDLARIEAGRVTISLEPVSVPEVLQEVTATLQPMAERAQIALAVAPHAARLPLVHADRTRLAQILMNYGSNAIKYGRAGGHVTFQVATAAGALRLTVRDDGPGIPAAYQARIFEPFQRAGQETGPIEGSGIGLAISKRLAELMGGRVGFESAEGSGSAFWVEIPLHQASLSAPPEALPGEGLASPLSEPGPRHVVVYVEDNPSNIALMRELMDDLASIELLTAPTAEIGLELIRSRQPKVVIMDINLPGISGFEATKRLASWPETRHIPVIALTAAAMPRDTARAAEVGFYRYLTKPVKVDELTRVLEELLDAR